MTVRRREKRMVIWALMSLCLLLATSLHAAPLSITQRYHALIKEIRCVVCQNQTIADSEAPLASDLRKKVYELMLEKKSDDDIKAYLVKRYGEFILFKPRLNKLTLLLWGFPFMGLVGIAWVLWRLRITMRAANS